MQFYTKQHKYYCGIDLHTKKMFICILDEKGDIREHKNIKTDRDVFLKTISPYREDIVVAVECITGLLIFAREKESPSSLVMPFT